MTSVGLGLSEDQEALKATFDAFFAKESPPAVARGSEPLGFDQRLWARLVAVDAPGMGRPADRGGGGAGLGDLVVVAEALGRAIAPVPLIEHLVATRAHPTSTDSVIATLALRPANQEGGWSLVPAGAVADLVVGLDGDELVAVRADPPGRAPANHACAPLADRSARQGDRTVIGTAAEFASALDEWRVLTAGALVGMAAACLAMAVDYVLTRHQFGVPIGSFQAVQHGLAGLPALVDGGRLLAHKAAWAADSGPRPATADPDDNDINDGSCLAAMALVFAADAAAQTTERALHYHGGYGFAEESDVQLYYRRARGWALVLGDPTREYLAVADRLWPPPGG